MKLSCDIIKDLLPLYHDDVCSNDSKTMVEEHLANCDDCKAELQAMDGLTITGTEKNMNKARAVKNISIKWKRGMKKSLLEGILIAIVAFALVALVLYVFIGFRVVSIF
jgi:predicted anti-sigma-YlaC factor YlaD